MVSWAHDTDLLEEWSTERFEKMPRKHTGWMPSRTTRPAQSASVRTPASRRASREVAQRVGGKHRRCRRTWN